MLGVHPAEGHDIPGVRSLRQLKLTDFFLPKEYDGHRRDRQRGGLSALQAPQPGGEHHRGAELGHGAGRRVQAGARTSRARSAWSSSPTTRSSTPSSFRKHLPELFPAATEAAPAAGPSPDILQSIQDLAQGSADVIDHDEAVALVRAGALLVDVRTPQEFEGGHVAEAVNVPLSALGALGAPGLPNRHDRPVVTMCGVGKRSLTAMLLLKAQGYERVKSIARRDECLGGVGPPAEDRLVATRAPRPSPGSRS